MHVNCILNSLTLTSFSALNLSAEASLIVSHALFAGMHVRTFFLHGI